METGLSAADIVAMTKDTNGNGGNGYGNGAWDNPFIYLVWLALLGNGGIWGNRGNNGDGGSGSGGWGGWGGYPALYEGFNNQDVNGQLRGITQGICDGFYAVNTGMLQGFSGVQRDLCQGFNGVTAGINNLGYQLGQCCCDIEKGNMQNAFQTQSGFNTLSHQLADCCCENRSAIAQVRYDMASQACDTRNLIQNVARDITDTANANTRSILDFLVQDKISSLQAENQALKFQASQTAQNAFITANQEAQTAELIRRLGADCPVPAYVVQAPTPVSFPTNCCGQVQFAQNSNCGCGCGCY